MFYKADETSSILKESDDMHYVLMNKDKELTSFKLKDYGEYAFNVSDIEVISSSPYEDRYDLLSFLEERLPYRKREYLFELLLSLRINSTSEYLDTSYALSLNDTYWVKRADSDNCWADVNLYKKDFNKAVARYLLSGEPLAGIPVKTVSPEFTTNGMLPKCWERYDDEVYLFKGGTVDSKFEGNEPYSEYYISQIEEAMQIEKYVPYDLDMVDGVLVSKCKLFTSEDVGFKPYYKVDMPRTFYDIIKFYKSHGILDVFNDMAILDVITVNYDRHLNNYGFLVDNVTGEVIDTAPVFDNGAGLLPYYTMDRNINKYAFLRNHSSGLSFYEIAYECLTDRQRKMLKRLIDFKFKRHPKYNLPEDRLERLEQLIQTRVQDLLKMKQR